MFVSNWPNASLNPITPGILTALTQPSPDALRHAIRETRKLTSKPFGVNITLLPSINPPDYAGYARAAVEEGVRIFETAGNNRACSHCPRMTGTDWWCISGQPYPVSKEPRVHCCA